MMEIQYIQQKEKRWGKADMVVRQRVLAAKLAERVEKNPALAKQMGIEIKYHKFVNNCNNKEIRSADSVK